MALRETIQTLTEDPVAGGAALIGAVAGLAGAFAVTRRGSLQGDVVSHAALPGIATAVLLNGTSPFIMLLGGAIAGWLALLAVSWLSQKRKCTADSALAIVLATFFGFGLLLKSIVQQRIRADSEALGLDQFLFGQAATMRTGDLAAAATVGIVMVVLVVFAWHRCKLVCFDAGLAKSLGIRVEIWNGLLTTMIVAATVIGLQAVGVVLMSALLVAPAVAARLCTHRFEYVVIGSTIIGALSGVGGVMLSLQKRNLSTGPVIVLTATGMVLIASAVAMIRTRSRLREETNRGTLPAVR